MTVGLEHIAQARAIALGLDVQVQLEKATRPGCQPMLVLLADARERAMKAMMGLCMVDPTDSKSIRGFQNEVTLFDDMARSLKKVIERGREADRLVTEEERAAINEMIAESIDGDVGPTEVNDR